MLRNVCAKGRRMVVTVDPHLKRDSDYRVYREARDNDHLVRTKDGAEYDGWCWPGQPAVSFIIS